MTQRQAVQYICVYLWKRERFGIIFTLLFAIYMGSVISLSIDGNLENKEVPEVLNGIIDWIYLTMFPVFGLVMNKSAFGMWRDDYYSKRMAHWRTMPIPVASIVQARFLQTIVILPVIGICFLFLQYMIAPNLRDAVSPVEWLENGLIWMCYSFIINAMYVLLELGYSGKRYVLGYSGYMGVTAIVTAILTWQGIHLFEEVLRATEEGHAFVFIIGLGILAVVASWLSYRATINRIRTRSITF
ncbi:hypothetical protein [Cohnella silvisoli]|uniref:ABC-2 transporter permease n=1 Tax=Cohnella silvisoli TaxID=2873699 RepID=A0ABV1KMN1_9BACL|nr:hypothetical protein [Cohnella silvisoli]MCD9020591.1 hypothetical protein [Cohnella silvisoli]